MLQSMRSQRVGHDLVTKQRVLGPVNGTLFGKGAFAEVTKLRI